MCARPVIVKVRAPALRLAFLQQYKPPRQIDELALAVDCLANHWRRVAGKDRGQRGDRGAPVVRHPEQSQLRLTRTGYGIQVAHQPLALCSRQAITPPATCSGLVVTALEPQAEHRMSLPTSGTGTAMGSCSV